MRINVYAEELTTETELVTKTVNDEKFGERTFYGIRVFLHSPEQLHSDPADDDRSAITFWVPWTRAGGHDFGVVGHMLNELQRRHHEAHHAEFVKADAAYQPPGPVSRFMPGETDPTIAPGAHSIEE